MARRKSLWAGIYLKVMLKQVNPKDTIKFKSIFDVKILQIFFEDFEIPIVLSMQGKEVKVLNVLYTPKTYLYNIDKDYGELAYPEALFENLNDGNFVKI